MTVAEAWDAKLAAIEREIRDRPQLILASFWTPGQLDHLDRWIKPPPKRGPLDIKADSPIMTVEAD